MVYCCGQCNQLEYYTFPYSICFLRWPVCMWPQSCSRYCLPHSNRLKYLGSLITGASVTEGPSSSVSSIETISSFVLMLSWAHSDSLYSIELSSTTTLYYSPFSVEHTCNKFLSARNSFDSLSSKLQMCKVGFYSIPVISVFTGSTWKLRKSSLIIHLANCLTR